jgi:dihydropteroate synthase
LGEAGEASVGEALEALEIGDGAEASRGAEWACDAMAAALVVGGGAEATCGSGFKLDAFEESVEREVEVEPGLFAVGDDVESGIDLVVDGDDDGVVDEFLAVSVTELLQVGGGEFKPGGEGVAADDRGAERLRLHRRR